MRPLKALFVTSDDSIHEWRFRWQLDRLVSSQMGNWNDCYFSIYAKFFLFFFYSNYFTVGIFEVECLLLDADSIPGLANIFLLCLPLSTLLESSDVISLSLYLSLSLSLSPCLSLSLSHLFQCIHNIWEMIYQHCIAFLMVKVFHTVRQSDTNLNEMIKWYRPTTGLLC